VNYPLQYFAERIGGDRVSAALPVPRDVDPAFWAPDVADVALYQQADLVLLNGAGYAGWVRNVSLPPSKLVDTSAGFKERYIPVDAGATHTHGPEGEHEHGETAFTTWLDLRLALEQARAIALAFEKARPEGRAAFSEGLASLERDLLGLDESLRATLAGGEVRMIGSHPVYQYLARGYGVAIPSVHFEPEEFPSDGAWTDLEAKISDGSVKWMLWEGEPIEPSRARLAKLGLGSVVFDPCGNAPEQGDFMSVMRANVANLKHAFGQTARSGP
jgi:zinc transport system substrate-binding protein